MRPPKATELPEIELASETRAKPISEHSLSREGFSNRCRVSVLLKGYYLTAANGMDVHKVAFPGAPSSFDLPGVMTEHHDFVALCMNSRSSKERTSWRLPRFEKNSPTPPRPCRLPPNGTFSISGCSPGNVF
jgi:hypothetical protein